MDGSVKQEPWGFEAPEIASILSSDVPTSVPGREAPSPPREEPRRLARLLDPQEPGQREVEDDPEQDGRQRHRDVAHPPRVPEVRLEDAGDEPATDAHPRCSGPHPEELPPEPETSQPAVAARED